MPGFCRPVGVTGLGGEGWPGKPPSFIPRFSANDGPRPGGLGAAPGTAGEELKGWGPGRFSCGGSLKPAGKPVEVGPGEATAEGGWDDPGGPRFGAGVVWRDMEKAFILAAMSGLEMPPRAAMEGPLGSRRAADKLPSGCEDAVIFEIAEALVASLLVSLVVRRGEKRRRPGLGGSSSGEVGGEGESREEGCSSGEVMTA